jgi:DNA-binding transcriptional ArsR family regulator
VDNCGEKVGGDVFSGAMHPFEVMAEPVRRRIIDILASGEHTSGELAEVIAMEYRISASAVSKHLRRMLDAGFVEVRADMTNRVYRLSEEGLADLEAEVGGLRKKFDERIGWFGPGDRFIAGVALKGVGRPGRRGGRGKGVAQDPWRRKWTDPAPFPAGGRVSFPHGDNGGDADVGRDPEAGKDAGVEGHAGAGAGRDVPSLVDLVDLEELEDLDGPIGPARSVGFENKDERDDPKVKDAHDGN